LYWDGQGFCLYYKVLEKGRFPWPTATAGTARLTSAQLGHAVGRNRLAAARLGRAAGAGWLILSACFALFLWRFPGCSMVDMGMSTSAPDLPDDPAVLKAMIAALRAENAQITATLRAHDLLVQALRVRIAKLKKQAFGKSSEKIEREIEQLELALEDLQVAMAEADTAPPEDGITDEGEAPERCDRGQDTAAARASPTRPRANAANSIPATPARTAAASCGLWARMSASCST
jgi:hypothetical protein